MTKAPVSYPYLPEGRDIKYVKASNPFMLAAKKATEKTGCRKQPTGAVLVKDGKILMTATNAGRTVEVCPRVLKGSKTGTDYHYCKETCRQEGHSEWLVSKKAIAKKIDSAGADVYLWGHWWCCQPCWDAMIEAGIKNVYLEERAWEKFNLSSTIGKIYISGALTIQGGRRNLRKIYEKVAAVCSNFCNNVYVPHLNGTDPVKDPSELPSIVWKTDHREVASSDLIIAYVGMPSLGTGAELEIARMAASDIILWHFEDEKVSRMALGNPNVKTVITAKDEVDFEEKLRAVLKKY